MGITTFTGPIKAGDVIDTTGTAAGSVKNVGFAVMVQTADVTQAGTTSATATGICIPAYSHIVSIHLLNTAGWSGASGTISLGTTTTATDLVSGGTVSAVGINTVNPGTDATRTAKWSNIGASDVLIYALSANTGSGVGTVVIRYIQAENA